MDARSIGVADALVAVMRVSGFDVKADPLWPFMLDVVEYLTTSSARNFRTLYCRMRERQDSRDGGTPLPLHEYAKELDSIPL